MFGWSAVQPNCSRNVVLVWKQSMRSNWSNAKIRPPNLHLIFKNITEMISTKIDSYRASTSAFHLDVQDPSVAYREASCIATFKVSECTWLNLYYGQIHSLLKRGLSPNLGNPETQKSNLHYCNSSDITDYMQWFGHYVILAFWNKARCRGHYDVLA